MRSHDFIYLNGAFPKGMIVMEACKVDSKALR